MRWRTLAFLPCAVLACSGGDGTTPDAALPDARTDAGGTADAAVDAIVPTSECLKALNLARVQELLAAQPVLEARSRQIITAQVSFASVAGDPQISCSVELRFKDSSGNGALDRYENWTLPAAERAVDLLSRMSVEQKLGLLAHATTTDVPSGAAPAPSAGLRAQIEAGIRFGRTAANRAQLIPRATWANNVQALCESEELGIPFVLSAEPSHATAHGRVKAAGFSQWPSELGLAATGDLALIERFGRVVSQEYRAIGVRMALSPSASLLTEPRWWNGQFSFGEDRVAAGDRVAAFVRGAQGTALGPESVACVVDGFPGAGAARDGWDARLAKGKFLMYPGGNIDAHLAPFGKAFEAGVAGVMPAYGIPQAGSWSGLGGVIDGATIEQVGASFNPTLMTAALRGHYGFGGLALSPWGILEDAGFTPLGAPWGVEALDRPQRAARALNAGIDQLGGLDDLAPLVQARGLGLIGDARIDAAAARALVLMLELGLFEDPYVDAARAPALCNSDPSYRAGLDAMNRSMVLLVNQPKPIGWLDGNGDGTQTGDKGNAGNGSLRVLPAPPGEPYVSAGCSYFILGNFDLDYVRSVSTGYGELTNDATAIKGIPVTTAAERIALSDYVFVRIDAPFSSDPDSGALDLCKPTLTYAASDNRAELDDLAFARAAIDEWNATRQPESRTQIIVTVDGGRPSVLDEIQAYGPSGLYLAWYGTYPGGNLLADKVVLDVAFGIFNGTGKLPAGLPLSDGAAAGQMCDMPGDGQHATFRLGYGFETRMFQ